MLFVIYIVLNIPDCDLFCRYEYATVQNIIIIISSGSGSGSRSRSSSNSSSSSSSSTHYLLPQVWPGRLTNHMLQSIFRLSPISRKP